MKRKDPDDVLDHQGLSFNWRKFRAATRALPKAIDVLCRRSGQSTAGERILVELLQEIAHGLAQAGEDVTDLAAQAGKC